MHTRQTFLSASWQVDALPAVRPAAGGAAVTAAYRWLDVSAPRPPVDGIPRRASGAEETTLAASDGWQSFVADATLRHVVDLASNDDAVRGTRTDWIADVIHAYVTRDGALRRRRLGTLLLDAREASLGMTARRARRDLADELDYQEAVDFVHRAQAELERVDREFRQADAVLRILVGARASEHLPACAGSAALLVHDIAPGVPSELLTRRPDIRAAERRLSAGNIDIGAARAAFFPQIALTGLFGSGSAELSDLTKPGRHISSYSPRATLPHDDLATAAYERAIRTAFREVSAALAAVDALRREEDARCSAACASAQECRASRTRYRDGSDDRRRLLAVQRDDLASQVALIEVRTRRQLALVTLFRVLGGGWR